MLALWNLVNEVIRTYVKQQLHVLLIGPGAGSVSAITYGFPMTTRNFVLTVKEQQAGKPCFLVFEAYEEIGLGKKADGASSAQRYWHPSGKALAKSLNNGVAKIAVT